MQILAKSSTFTNYSAGHIYDVASNLVPDGTLECDGLAVSRTTYATLFSIIGTTFGAGDGATTFNVPNFTDKITRGFDNGKGVDPGRILGSTQNSTTKLPAATTVVSVASLAHTHAAKNTNTTGAHTHGISAQSSGTSTNCGAGVLTTAFLYTVGSAGAHTHTSTIADSIGHTHTGTVDVAGGSTNTRGAFLNVIKVIKF